MPSPRGLSHTSIAGPFRRTCISINSTACYNQTLNDRRRNDRRLLQNFPRGREAVFTVCAIAKRVIGDLEERSVGDQRDRFAQFATTIFLENRLTASRNRQWVMIGSLEHRASILGNFLLAAPLPLPRCAVVMSGNIRRLYVGCAPQIDRAGRQTITIIYLVWFVLPAGNDSRRRLVEFVGGFNFVKMVHEGRWEKGKERWRTWASFDRGSWITMDILDLIERRNIIWVSTNSLSLFSFSRTIHHSRDPLIFMRKRRL